jgi:hypothetical protein
MMEAARTSETLVNVYQTTRRYNPEDSHLRTHRRENLKSYLVKLHYCIWTHLHCLEIIQSPPKVITVFQTAVLIRSNFYRKCKVKMKEHMLEIVHKLCPENHLR